MTQPPPDPRLIAANSASSREDRKRAAATPQPLPAAEIEAILRMARRNLAQSKQVVQDEETGPGDVQYLRGDSTSGLRPDAPLSPPSSWPETSGAPDSTLRQAERLLAEAILDDRIDAHFAELPITELNTNSADRSANPNGQQGLSLEDLGELDLDISIELGRTEILIEDVLKLREGSVVSLDKLAGDPVDIIANGRLVARGELLVIDGKFGVRLSEVL